MKYSTTVSEIYHNLLLLIIKILKINQSVSVALCLNPCRWANEDLLIEAAPSPAWIYRTDLSLRLRLYSIVAVEPMNSLNR